jgi:hypothetical protein
MDIAATVYGSFTAHETFDIGRDEGMPVNEEYADRGKFEFTPGQLHKVVFDIKNPEEKIFLSRLKIGMNLSLACGIGVKAMMVSLSTC